MPQDDLQVKTSNTGFPEAATFVGVGVGLAAVAGTAASIAVSRRRPSSKAALPTSAAHRLDALTEAVWDRPAQDVKRTVESMSAHVRSVSTRRPTLSRDRIRKVRDQAQVLWDAARNKTTALADGGGVGTVAVAPKKTRSNLLSPVLRENGQAPQLSRFVPPALSGRRPDALAPRPTKEPSELGTLRGESRFITTRTGTRIFVDIDEPDTVTDDTLTVIMCHGYALSLDSWHFQRLALRGKHRVVLFDQRGHGRSDRCVSESASIEALGRDLADIIDEVAPIGPLVLLGHSMGGMTIMAYAKARPAEFKSRVVGAGLIATSAGELDDHDFGAGVAAPLLHAAAPWAVDSLKKYPQLAERARKVTSPVESAVVQKFAYVRKLDPQIAKFTPELIAATPIDVVSDFVLAFREHDMHDALGTFAGVETLVLVGDKDMMTPALHSEQLVRAIPHAEHIVVPEAGHMVLLECPDVVNEAIGKLVESAERVQALHENHVF